MSRNWRYILVMAIVRGVYMPGALAISFNHILTAGHMSGLTGWQAWTTPAFLDGFALIGMVMRSRCFDADVRRFGLRLQIGAGAGSLAANIFAGHTVGERIYGALVVAGLVVAELAGERLHASQPGKRAATPVDRSAAAKKAAATRAANKAKADADKAAAAQRRRVAREVAGLEAKFAAAAAPVSGAPALAPAGEDAAYL